MSTSTTEAFWLIAAAIFNKETETSGIQELVAFFRGFSAIGALFRLLATKTDYCLVRFSASTGKKLTRVEKNRFHNQHKRRMRSLAKRVRDNFSATGTVVPQDRVLDLWKVSKAMFDPETGERAVSDAEIEKLIRKVVDQFTVASTEESECNGCHCSCCMPLCGCDERPC